MPLFKGKERQLEVELRYLAPCTPPGVYMGCATLEEAEKEGEAKVWM